MPIREYCCRKCGETKEDLVLPRESEKYEPPRCCGEVMQPMISAPGTYQITGANDASTRPSKVRLVKK